MDIYECPPGRRAVHVRPITFGHGMTFLRTAKFNLAPCGRERSRNAFLWGKISQDLVFLGRDPRVKSAERRRCWEDMTCFIQGFIQLYRNIKYYCLITSRVIWLKMWIGVGKTTFKLLDVNYVTWVSACPWMGGEYTWYGLVYLSKWVAEYIIHRGWPEHTSQGNWFVTFVYKATSSFWGLSHQHLLFWSIYVIINQNFSNYESLLVILHYRRESIFHHSTKAIPLRMCKMILIARPTVQSWNSKNEKFWLGRGALFTLRSGLNDSIEICEFFKCEPAIVLTQPKPLEWQPCMVMRSNTPSRISEVATRIRRALHLFPSKWATPQSPSSWLTGAIYPSTWGKMKFR